MKLLVFEMPRKGAEGCKGRGQTIGGMHQKKSVCSSTQIRCCACPGRRQNFVLIYSQDNEDPDKGFLIKCIIKYCV